MDESFLTFHIFPDRTSAENFAASLAQKGIEVKVVYDAIVPSKGSSSDVRIKIKQDDFAEASKLLEAIQQPVTVSKPAEESFLYDCTDEELMEIVSKPEEWNNQDVELAHKILKERGLIEEPHPIPEKKKVEKAKVEKPKAVKVEKPKVVKAPKIKVPRTKISIPKSLVFSYIISILISPIGLFIGWQMAYSKKVLPDGTEEFVNDEPTRKHGEWILLISLIILMALVPFLITRAS